MVSKKKKKDERQKCLCLSLTTYKKKINPKWTIDLNLICKTIDICRKIQE